MAQTQLSSPAAARELLNAPPELKILALRDSLRPEDAPCSPRAQQQKRDSGASGTDGGDDTRPAALEADLVHYKELFAKLRFSYVEQGTKERFLEALMADPPRLVEAAEIEAREKDILEAKAHVKEQKAEVAALLQTLESRARDLARRYEALQPQRETLEALPPQIATLKKQLAQLQSQTRSPSPSSQNAHLSLPLAETQALLQSRVAENAALDAHITRLRADTLPAADRELEAAESELKLAEMRKDAAVRKALLARERKEKGGGAGEEAEHQARWLTAQERFLRGVLTHQVTG